MAEETAGELDVSNPVFGSIRSKGYRLIDLIWLPMILGIAYTCLSLFQHEATAQQDKARIAATLEKSNHDIAGALKESNTAIVQALKESNSNTLQAIRELATEQRRATNAIKEVACLSDPAMKDNRNAREFCKRVSSQ